MKHYILRVLVAFDVLLNAVLNGDEDMTISLRAARSKRDGALWGRATCSILDIFEKGHCDMQFNTEEGIEHDS